jgi:membrane-associated protease RseP (regulator of RpoE activity)
MPEVNQSARRVSREMRLLILTIVVSGAVLLLLARLRFPELPPAVDTSSQPLERLAARASFEELATRVGQLETSIAPNLVVLRLASPVDPDPVRLADLTSRRQSAPVDTGHVPALRIDAGTAVAAIPPNVTIGGIVGPVGPTDTAGIVARDSVRHVARIRVPAGRSRSLPQLALAALQTPAYVVAVEGTRAGLTLRPVFLGRSDRFGSPRWRRPLLPLGGAIVTPGALMFTLDGEFLGCAVVEDGTLAIAGASDVLDAVSHLGGGAGASADPGISVQALTATLAEASGAPGGVVVAEVFDNGAASGLLEPGDVIVELDGQPVEGLESLLVDISARLAAGPVQLGFIRQREARSAEIRPPAVARAAVADAGARPIVLELARGVGTTVRGVSEGSPFAAAGLAAGDVIVRAGSVAAPTPAQVRAALRKTTGGQFLLLVVRRGSIQRVTAVKVEDSGDAARR